MFRQIPMADAILPVFLATIRYIPKNILVAKKPNMHEFLSPLFHELDSIYEKGGIHILKNKETHNFIPLLLQCVCDLPAKAELQGMLNHNGYHSCGYCFHLGQSIKGIKNSQTYVRYVREKKQSVSRTHKSMLKIYETLGRIPNMSIKKISCMIAAREFNLIDGFCIDYMHCVLLGVVAKLMSLWLDSTNHNPPFNMKPKFQIILNQRLTKIKPISDISRKPRALSERANFKANEYRNLLLFFFTYCLKDLLPKKYIDNFKLVSSLIFVLLKREITFEEITDAEIKLNTFATEFENLYGRHNVTTNVHLLRHIGQSVRCHGPLWAQSAFGFESNNGILVKTNSKKHILHSIAWRYTINSTLQRETETKKNQI